MTYFQVWGLGKHCSTSLFWTVRSQYRLTYWCARVKAPTATGPLKFVANLRWKLVIPMYTVFDLHYVSSTPFTWSKWRYCSTMEYTQALSHQKNEENFLCNKKPITSLQFRWSWVDEHTDLNSRRGQSKASPQDININRRLSKLHYAGILCSPVRALRIHFLIRF